MADNNQLNNLERAKRFLVLGTEGSTYYATAVQSYNENISCIVEILRENEEVDQLLDMLEQYSGEGRVAKEDAILAALAICVLFDNPEIQKKAYAKVVNICTTPTRLFLFTQLCQTHIIKMREEMTPKPSRSSGWGRLRRKSIGAFYTELNKDPERLLYLVTKYKNRYCWNHKQLLGYVHPKFSKDDEAKIAKEMVLCYVTRGYTIFRSRLAEKTSPTDQLVSRIKSYIDTLEKVKCLDPSKKEDVVTLVGFINTFGVRNYDEAFTTELAVPRKEETPLRNNTGNKKEPFQLVREHIPNGFLKIGEVWEALLQDMPTTAILRNLGRMSSFRLFEKKKNVEVVVNALTNPARLKKAMIHRIKILIALKAYGKGRWKPKTKILNVLEKSFYLSIKQPELKMMFKTGKKLMLALSVNESMTCCGCCGCQELTPSMAATALAMSTWNIEDNVEMVAFGNNGLENLEEHGFTKTMQLKAAMNCIKKVHISHIDVSSPMLYAKNKNLDIDAFIVYTGSDTGFGRINPTHALREYRQAMNKPDAKLIVVAMTSNGFTIADPDDDGMLDVVGFDSSIPEMIAEFVRN